MYRRTALIPLSALTLTVLLAAAVSRPVHAQTFSILHNFTDGADGGAPAAGLTLDSTGNNLYGTTQQGGAGGSGVVYRVQHTSGGWVFSTLYGFSGLSDGGQPLAGVRFGPHGSLYGTTYGGGNGTGVVFNLRPSPTFCRSVSCPWNETVIYRFASFGGGDGAYPEGDLVFDTAGNLYGTTFEGGSDNAGSVYELTPSGGGWTEQVIYSFNPVNGEGVGPMSGVIFDQAGNLYGTTNQGGAHNCGDVYQLTRSGSGWTRTLVYAFQCATDGSSPVGGLIFDGSGNLYGTTSQGGSGQGGTAFMLTPSNGSWVFRLLYPFDGLVGFDGPTGTLAMDANGDLYGTREFGRVDFNGSVFELALSNGMWTYVPLHDFTGGSDGANPIGDILRDTNGKLYGSTYLGGTSGRGTVWEITP